MYAVPKYVLTHGREQTGWANSHAITADDGKRRRLTLLSNERGTSARTIRRYRFA